MERRRSEQREGGESVLPSLINFQFSHKSYR